MGRGEDTLMVNSALQLHCVHFLHELPMAFGCEEPVSPDTEPELGIGTVPKRIGENGKLPVSIGIETLGDVITPIISAQIPTSTSAT